MPVAPGGGLGHFKTAPLGSEAGRAFLQGRIRKFALIASALSAFFLVAGNAVALSFIPEVTLPRLVTFRGNQLHFAALAATTCMWLLTRSSPRSERALAAIDLLGNLTSMSLYAAMAVMSPTNPQERIDVALLLIAGLSLMLRAIIVPSSVRQTALVSAATCVPVWIVSWIFAARPDVPAQYANLIPASSAMWCLADVVVATLATRVIFGLRTQVAEARQLGQYLLGEKIGEGGMGEVYRARHALLRRPTAIKLLPPDKAGAHDISRFEREVQLTAKLTHPNTVAIYDFGRTPEGVFYYAMELLEGVDLEHLVDEYGPQSPARVIHILAQVCGSLAEAHAVGLVHRDVKPANVILCERGLVPDTAKVVDFGLVKDIAGLSGARDPSLSSADSIIGTPLYLAPEAIQSPDKVDGRADLYALGAVGYFLLTGTPVFSGETLMEVCAEHLHTSPAPPSERLGRPLPPDLERAVLGCLAKKPEERPQNADELREQLLACDVPPWTTAEARSWWREYAPKLTHGQRRTTPPAMTALTVDLAARERAVSDKPPRQRPQP